MNVFLSWSGAQSKAVAEALRDWLPLVINAVEPWMSSEIDKGRKWSTEISDRLEHTSFGIICLTRNNLTSPWLLFEAGALSKARDAFVSTFLYDLAPTDVEQPLAQFQHTEFTETDIAKLVRTINSAVNLAGERGVAETNLPVLFSALWPALKTQLTAASAYSKGSEAVLRTDRAILEEILGILRAANTITAEEFSRQRPLLGALFEGSDSVGRARTAVVFLDPKFVKEARMLQEGLSSFLHPTNMGAISQGPAGLAVDLPFPEATTTAEIEALIKLAAKNIGLPIKNIRVDDL